MQRRTHHGGSGGELLCRLDNISFHSFYHIQCDNTTIQLIKEHC